MLRSITPQVTDETLNRAQAIADQTDNTAASPVLDYLNPDIEYPVYTLLDNFDAAQQLEDYLKQI
jgi:hypothetical protein